MNIPEQTQETLHRVFIKVSGDEYLNPDFRDWIKQINQHSWVVICVGGGTQINDEFGRRGWPVMPHGPMGRESETFEHRQVARDILELNQVRLQNWLAEEKIFAAVEIPIVSIGTVLCPVNGDLMVQTAYLGFDDLYVITTPERLAKKQAEFSHLPKVVVKAFG